MALTFILADYSMEAEDWEGHRVQVLQSLARDLEAYPGGRVEYDVADDNRGLGADWYVVVVTVLSVAGTGFFAIPAAHKKVREAIEEWRRIRDGLKALTEWLLRHRRLMA